MGLFNLISFNERKKMRHIFSKLIIAITFLINISGITSASAQYDMYDNMRMNLVQETNSSKKIEGLVAFFEITKSQDPNLDLLKKKIAPMDSKARKAFFETLHLIASQIGTLSPATKQDKIRNALAEAVISFLVKLDQKCDVSKNIYTEFKGILRDAGLSAYYIKKAETALLKPLNSDEMDTTE